mmetsp:Transcript_17877/g.28533  ORF Transcript_17877/g.28533 Transcript_17877/m.28533 type:complete len:119 (+) Transcript_17877:44-400(+)
MNGSTAIVELRKHEARGRQARPQLVVVTTGNSATSDLYIYQKAGFQGILVKPINVKFLGKWLADFHAFWELTAGAGNAWTPGQTLPPGCPRPEVKSTSLFEDGYFFGDLQVFGTVPRR